MLLHMYFYENTYRQTKDSFIDKNVPNDFWYVLQKKADVFFVIYMHLTHL